MTTLIVFSHLRWGFVHQRPQHLLSRLARERRVLFVEEPVHAQGPARLECIAQAPNIDLLVARTEVEAPGFHDDQLPVLTPLLETHLREHGIDDYIVWFYTPMALPLIARWRPRAIVYDCIDDDLAAGRSAPRQLRQRESALLRSAHLVLTGGPAMDASKRALHPNVHCIPSAVDTANFAPAPGAVRGAAATTAERLQSALPRPRLGFHGVIDERVDLELLRALATARPAWQFVMVGPVVKLDAACLPRLPNLHWLGMQAHATLPHLMAGWDLGLMPFALDASTRFLSPTQPLEFMAAGKPIVSTPVADVVALYGAVVEIADGPAPFIAACEKALAEDDATRAARLAAAQAVVARASWEAAAHRVDGLLNQVLRQAPAAPAMTQQAETLNGHRGTTTAFMAPGARVPLRVRHLVIGAGPTGLAAAWHLGQDAALSDTLLIEREARVGGRSRSVVEQGCTFDPAGHVMGSDDAWVLGLYQKLLGAIDARDGDPLRGGALALLDGFLPLLNCELACKTRVIQISPAARSARLDDGRLVHFDSLVSTMPLPSLVDTCGSEAPAEVQAAANGLRQVSVQRVNLGFALAEGATRPTVTHWFDDADDTAFQLVHDPAAAANAATIRRWFASFGIVLAGRGSERDGDNADHADHPFLAGRRAAEQSQSNLVAARSAAG